MSGRYQSLGIAWTLSWFFLMVELFIKILKIQIAMIW